MDINIEQIQVEVNLSSLTMSDTLRCIIKYIYNQERHKFIQKIFSQSDSYREPTSTQLILTVLRKHLSYKRQKNK